MDFKEHFSGTQILVVGGRGFIGRHVVDALIENGACVKTLSLSKPASGTSVTGVEHLTADIRDLQGLRKAAGENAFDYVVNAAGYINHVLYGSGGRDLIEQHFQGTMNLLDIVKRPGLKGYVHLGSSDEYGHLEAPQKEAMREMPISPYSAAKVAASHLVEMLHRTEQMPGVVLRLFLVYGPGQDDRRFLPQVIKGCLGNRVFETSLGTQLRDFCYVEDVVEAILLALVTEEAYGKVLNVASGRAITIREMIEKVVSIVKGGKPEFGKIPYRVMENMALYADISRAGEIIGWQPKTGLDAGLGKTIAWYRNR